MIRAKTAGARRRPRWPMRYLLVTGDSMAPALRDGDWVLAHVADAAAVGQVVVARRPGDSMLLVKRVVEVTPGGYWLVGDNPAASTDSRHFGAVPQVLAQVIWRVRPWGPVRRPARASQGRPQPPGPTEHPPCQQA